MAGEPPDPTTIGVSPDPSLGAPATATPVLSGSPGSSGASASGPPRPGMPILYSFLKNIIKPPMQAPAPGEMAQRVPRLQTFESFLGNFLQAFSAGMSQTGPGANARGFAAAVSAPYQQALQQYQLGQQQQKTQAETQETQARTGLINKQADLAGQMGTVNIPGMGPMTVPLNQLGNVLRGAAGAGLNAQSRMNVEMLKFRIMQGEVAKVEDYRDPQTGELGKMAYNKQGQPLGVVPGALPSSAYLPKSTSTTEFKEDAEGNILALPKTSTTQSVLPGGAARFPQQPQSSPGAPPSGFPKPRAAASGPRVVMQGKSSGDDGIAFNPQTGLNEQATRAEAASRGLQNWAKTPAGEMAKYRTSQAQFNDVQTNTSRYTKAAADAMQTPPTTRDYVNMHTILNNAGALDFDLKISAGGEIKLPMISALSEGLSREVNSEAYRNLSPQGKALIDGYFRTMASVPAYMKALTGVGRFNKEIVDLELRNIPNPTMSPQDIARKLSQWQENIDQGVSSVPTMKGIPSTQDIRKKFETPSPAPQPQQFGPQELQQKLNQARSRSGLLGMFKNLTDIGQYEDSGAK